MAVDGTSVYPEYYGTSWERDWPQAWNESRATLQALGIAMGSCLNGATDGISRAPQVHTGPGHQTGTGMDIDIPVRLAHRTNVEAQARTTTRAQRTPTGLNA